MRKSVEDYIRKCDMPEAKGVVFVAPLGKTQEPLSSFKVTSMDITGSY